MPSGPDVRWGFIGAGAIATRALAPAVAAATGATLYAVASREVNRARALGPERTYADYAALLADPRVDAVYISLPNHLHRPWALAALRAGRHVLVEKPFALSAAEVDEVAAAAGERVVVEAMWFRWHPRTSRLGELVRAGTVGAVRRIEAGFTFGGVPAGDYRLDPAMGGGALYDLGGYVTSAVALVAGAGSVRSVRARQCTGPTGVDLRTDASLEFDGGTARVQVGIDQEPAQWLRIVGDRGWIDVPDAPFTAWWATEPALTVHIGGRVTRERFPAVDAYRLMVEAVGGAVRGRGDWVLSLADSRACAAVLDAAVRSAAGGGRPVPVGA